MKKYMISSIVYACLAAVFGVLFRELTKFSSFTGDTVLATVHPHYFMLGMIFFLILLIMEKVFSFSDKKTNITLIIYQVGLNLTCLMLFVRGVLEVFVDDVTSTTSNIVAGFAGIGHVILGVSLITLLVLIFINIFKNNKEKKAEVKATEETKTEETK